jgi:hypothetical protein
MATIRDQLTAYSSSAAAAILADSTAAAAKDTITATLAAVGGEVIDGTPDPVTGKLFVVNLDPTTHMITRNPFTSLDAAAPVLTPPVVTDPNAPGVGGLPPTA